jgi:hypothetical protein
MTRNPDDATPPEAPDQPERRDFMKVASLAGAAAAFGAVGKFSSAQAATPPVQLAQATPAQWWPSRWGKDDEAGATNWITPEKVLDAAKWIKDGKVYKIGRTYEQGMPLFGARAFTLEEGPDRVPGGGGSVTGGGRSGG